MDGKAALWGLGAAVGLAAVVVAGTRGGDASTDLEARIASLEREVATLQAQGGVDGSGPGQFDTEASRRSRNRRSGAFVTNSSAWEYAIAASGNRSIRRSRSARAAQ